MAATWFSVTARALTWRRLKAECRISTYERGTLFRTDGAAVSASGAVGDEAVGEHHLGRAGGTAVHVYGATVFRRIAVDQSDPRQAEPAALLDMDEATVGPAAVLEAATVERHAPLAALAADVDDRRARHVELLRECYRGAIGNGDPHNRAE
eukprot:2631392-Prymnesium_polylepis.1